MPKFNWKSIETKVEDFVLEAAGNALSGPDKKDAVISEIIDFLDDKIFVFEGKGSKLKEIATDAVLLFLRTIIGFLVQSVYERLNKQGRV